jgi:hypothetical protein
MKKRAAINKLIITSYFIIGVTSNSPTESGGLRLFLSGFPILSVIFAQDQNKILNSLDQSFYYSSGSKRYNPIHQGIKPYWNMYNWMFEDDD